MAKIMFQFLLLLRSLLLLPMSTVAASPYPIYPLAKTDCLDICGNTSIPFPFGVGPDCFLHEWYEILCYNGIPRLKKLGLQVLNISFPRDKYSSDPSAITVNFPIFYSSTSCKPIHYRKREPVIFYGSPFFISQTDNIFVGVGCENVAMLKGSNRSFTGCITECTGKNTRQYSSCDGLDCCRSTIPTGLQGFTVDFLGDKTLGTSERDHDCQFAFPVDSKWFQPNSTDLYAVRDREYVPVMLRWGIVDAAFPTFIGQKLHDRTYFDVDYYYNYYYNNYYTYYYDQYYKFARPRNESYYESESAECREVGYINMNTTTFISCNCSYGYYGNPYIEDGCKDVNECEIPYYDGRMPCGDPRMCNNTRGSFYCLWGGGGGGGISAYLLTNIVVFSGPVIGLFLLICIPWCTCRVIKKRRKAKLKSRFFKKITLAWQLSSPEGNVEKGRLFTPKELDKATDHFNDDRILGKGGQGTVYKGMLTDGRIVAVKKTVALDEENVEPIINELVILSQINHRNIVKLLGCCLASEFPLLVYEFIPNGTLYQYLHDQEVSIPWEARLRIAIEVAGALFYLHSSASIPVFHRDIKSSNILLDEKYHAKIADFGTSRSVALDQTHLTTLVQGTFGYLDPEYFQTSQFTDKSDVYSFGVVLVELLTGQKPVCSLRVSEGRSLATYFVISMEENRLFDVVDATVFERGQEEEITAMANLVRRCLSPNGRERPTMREVVMELEGIRNPVLAASIIEEGQEIKRDHMKAKSLGIIDATYVSRGYGTKADATSFSDVHPFLRSESW